MRQLAGGMRQLAGTKTRYRRAHAAPLAGLVSDRVEYQWFKSVADLWFYVVARDHDILDN